MAKGVCEDVSSAVDIQGDSANPADPLVDELALGGRSGCGHLFGKIDGIEVASVAKKYADAVDIGDEALVGCRLSHRRRWHGGGQAGQNAKCADPLSGESSEPGGHGLTVSRKARSFAGGSPTRLLTSAERGSFRS